MPTLALPGFVLRYDSVAVPGQTLLPWMWGAGTAPPRSVPQDALVAVLDDVLAGWLVQRVLVLGGLLLLGFGVMRVLRRAPAVARVTAATVAVWSTYVFERVSIGHWGLLVGVACLPWLVDALQDVRAAVPGAVPRAVAWGALGSLVPTAGVLQVAATALVLTWPGQRASRPCLAALGGVLLLQLVWVVPGIVNPGSTPPDVSDVFAVRAEGSAGPVLTALGTGGIWSAGAMPTSRSGFASVVAPVILLVAASLGVRRFRVLPGPVIGPLAVLSVLGLGWALASTVPALAGAVQTIQSLPGGGLLRDAHKWLAPWLIMLAVLAGLGAARLADRFRDSGAGRPMAVLLVIAPIVLLPDMAFGMWGRLAPVQYPDGWDEVRASLAASDHPGDVLSWPWSAFRAYEWNEGRTVLDPASRYLPRTVVGDGRLLVEGEDGLVIVPSDDPRATDVGESLRAPDAGRRLGELGIGWILVQRGQPASPEFPQTLPAEILARTVTVVSSAELELRRLDGVAISRVDTGPAGARIAWLVWGCVLVGVALASVRHYVGPVPKRARRDRRRARAEDH